jgi:hypothetical protein
LIAADQSVPDLLRRFVSTPHHATVLRDGTRIAVETNDPELIAAMRRVAVSHSGDQARSTLSMKVVRDADAPCDGTQVTVLRSWPLLTLLAGTGTVLSFDCERGEILGFVAADVDPQHFAGTLLPILLEAAAELLSQHEILLS